MLAVNFDGHGILSSILAFARIVLQALDFELNNLRELFVLWCWAQMDLRILYRERLRAKNVVQNCWTISAENTRYRRKDHCTAGL